MRPSNAPPSVMEAIRETTSFNSNYARQAYEREDIWEIPDDMLEAFPEDLLPLPSNKQFADLPTNVNGSPKLQAATHELLGEFSDIFSRNVSTTPANVTPFTFEVNDKEWQHHKTQTKREDMIPRRPKLWSRQ